MEKKLFQEAIEITSKMCDAATAENWKLLQELEAQQVIYMDKIREGLAGKKPPKNIIPELQKLFELNNQVLEQAQNNIVKVREDLLNANKGQAAVNAYHKH